MLLAAFASLYHWKKAGTAVHEQRGSWMISRVLLTLGKKEGALEWAHRCQEISEKNLGEMEDFDLAYAQESLARAYALSGKQLEALIHWRKAKDLGNNIKDPEDKKIFMADFQGGIWYDLQID
jgi:tetratricopeptide (TPR) repeat protein